MISLFCVLFYSLFLCSVLFFVFYVLFNFSALCIYLYKAHFLFVVILKNVFPYTENKFLVSKIVILISFFDILQQLDSRWRQNLGLHFLTYVNCTGPVTNASGSLLTHIQFISSNILHKSFHYCSISTTSMLWQHFFYLKKKWIKNTNYMLLITVCRIIDNYKLKHTCYVMF